LFAQLIWVNAKIRAARYRQRHKGYF
jgi:hypothetical protein